MFTLICARINGWVNNGEAGDLRRNRAQYDVIVMLWKFMQFKKVHNGVFDDLINWIPELIFQIEATKFGAKHSINISPNFYHH